MVELVDFWKDFYYVTHTTHVNLFTLVILWITVLFIYAFTTLRILLMSKIDYLLMFNGNDALIDDVKQINEMGFFRFQLLKIGRTFREIFHLQQYNNDLYLAWSRAS